MKHPPGHFLLVCLIIGCVAMSYPCRAEWEGTHSGESFGSNKLLTCGDNILTVEAAYVWDNGEGKSPTGGGSNWGMAGPLPWKHGPYGSLHLVIYALDGRELHHTMLYGVWMTGSGKYEWKDDEGIYYTNYGVYDWDWHNDESVTVLVYESDPGPFREHDDLIWVRVNRGESEMGSMYSSYHMPVFHLVTRDLGQCPPKPTPPPERKEPGAFNRVP